MLLSVLPIQDKEEQRTLCELCHVEYGADLLAYKLIEGETAVGLCQFKMTRDGGSIVSLNCFGGEEFFRYIHMLGRGALNFMDLIGARYGYLDDPTVDDVIAKAIGFEKDENGRYKIDLKALFTSPCQSCKHE